MFSFLKKLKKEKNKKKFKKEFKIQDQLIFGEGTLVCKISTDFLLESINVSPLRSLVSDVVAEIVDSWLKNGMYEKKIKSFYGESIKNGKMIIWNNALYYYGMSELRFIRHEILSFIIDDFVKKYPSIANLEINSVSEFLKGEINYNEIIMHNISLNFYTQSLFNQIFEGTLDFLNKAAKSEGVDLIENDDFELYDIKSTMKENIKNKIKNNEVIFKVLKKKKFQFINQEELGFNREDTFVMGDYLDLNSIVENFIFLDISLLNKDAKCQIVSLGEKYMLITEGKDKSEDLKTTIELLNKTKI